MIQNVFFLYYAYGPAGARGRQLAERFGLRLGGSRKFPLELPALLPRAGARDETSFNQNSLESINRRFEMSYTLPLARREVSQNSQSPKFDHTCDHCDHRLLKYLQNLCNAIGG